MRHSGSASRSRRPCCLPCHTLAQASSELTRHLSDLGATTSRHADCPVSLELSVPPSSRGSSHTTGSTVSYASSSPVLTALCSGECVVSCVHKGILTSAGLGPTIGACLASAFYIFLRYIQYWSVPMPLLLVTLRCQAHPNLHRGATLTSQGSKSRARLDPAVDWTVRARPEAARKDRSEYAVRAGAEAVSARRTRWSEEGEQVMATCRCRLQIAPNVSEGGPHEV